MRIMHYGLCHLGGVTGVRLSICVQKSTRDCRWEGVHQPCFWGEQRRKENSLRVMSFLNRRASVKARRGGETLEQLRKWELC